MASYSSLAVSTEKVPPLTPAGQRRAAARQSILTGARELITENGFAAAQMSLIAVRAGVGVGSIYQHFPSRAELFAEVYRSVAAHEFDVVESAVAAATGGHVDRIAIAVQTFCTRALLAERFAYALLVEPAEAAVEEHRLAFREGYRILFARLIADGIEEGGLPAQDVDISAAAVLGIMTETLVLPLRDQHEMNTPEDLVRQVVALCLAAVTAVSTTTER